ncbi:MAG TPA: VOC family protein [Pyrinomonadaceae bacterium]|nr:VOC family protein [Pyrinomonadaceae bacterium]
MADFKIPGHGEICWRELRTTDLPIAVEFYTQLFGWTTEQSKVTDLSYKEIVTDGEATGGMMAIDDSWGPEPPPSHWATYIAVENADETAAKVVANGGKVHVPPFDAPGVGRIAMVADPSGADFAVIQFTEQPV